MSSGGRASTFVLAEGQSLSSDLGFLAQTVVVDNLTASWIDMRGTTGRFVPPFTYGATLPLAAGMQVAQASFATPPGIVPPTQGSGQAQFTFTAASLAPSNGQQVVIPSQQVLCTLSGLVVTGGSAAHLNNPTNTISTSGTGIITSGVVSVTAALPAGTNSIILTGSVVGSAAGVAIAVTGTQSGTLYYGGTLTFSPTENLPVEFVVSPAADSTLSITFTNVGSGGNVLMTTVGVVSSFGTQAVAVEGIVGSAVNTQITGPNGANGITPLPIFNNIKALPVLSGPEAGAFSIASMSGDITNASTVTPIVGSAGVRIILMAIYVNLSTLAVQAVDFKGSSSGVLWSLRCDISAGFPAMNFQPSGVALAAGESFQFTGETGNVTNMRGVVLFTLGI